MASQEFLASFAVDIDENGVSRLQEILDGNRDLADRLAAAFAAASAAMRSFTEEMGTLPGFQPGGTAAEGTSGLGSLALGLDTAAAEKALASFLALAKKPVPLTANASGIVSAARSAYASVRNIFSEPVSIRARVEAEGGSGGADPPAVKMSAGGRFSGPAHVQVAEDGNPEYIIPVRREERAVPLLRRLIGELSPAAREDLAGTEGAAFGPSAGGSLPALPEEGLPAGNAGAQIALNSNRMVSAPVNIRVYASGASAEDIGESLYDTTERYLVRTLRSAFQP